MVPMVNALPPDITPIKSIPGLRKCSDKFMKYSSFEVSYTHGKHVQLRNSLNYKYPELVSYI